MTWSSRFWKISPAGEISNGMRFHLYLPKGVAKVISRDASLLRGTLPIAIGAIDFREDFGFSELCQYVIDGLHWVMTVL